MEMYVLLGVTHYEGDTLLGVYTTREAAYRAYEVYCQTHTPFDRCGVEEMTVDAEAEARW